MLWLDIYLHERAWLQVSKAAAVLALWVEGIKRGKDAEITRVQQQQQHRRFGPWAMSMCVRVCCIMCVCVCCVLVFSVSLMYTCVN